MNGLDEVGGMEMTRVNKKRTAMVGIAGALAFGAAFIALRKLLDFDIDIDPWEEAFPG